MDYIKRLLNREKVVHDQNIKELSLNRIFYDEHRIEGSGERVEKIDKEILSQKEELAQIEFTIAIMNEGELNRIYLINKNKQTKGEKIS